jgi:membrane protein
MADWIKVYSNDSTIAFFNVLNLYFLCGDIGAFALMFKILPDAKIKWKHVWLGSIVTGILFTGW